MPIQFYTRKGDKGYTQDYAGKRLRKDDIRIICWGRVDELQAAVDLAILRSRSGAKKNQKDIKEMLEYIQRKLWQISGEISCSPPECVNEPVDRYDVLRLEKYIAWFGEPPKHFVRFTTIDAILFNECRVRCRALDRDLVKLLFKKQLRREIFQYANRLSSLLFMLAYKSSKI